MSSDNKNKYVYDLRRIEDVFACLEIISIARGILFGVDPGISGKLEKVSDALSDFSQLVLEGGLVAAEEVTSPETMKVEKSRLAADPVVDMGGDVFIDLTAPVKRGAASSGLTEVAVGKNKKKKSADMDEGIIDILTGERIK